MKRLLCAAAMVLAMASSAFAEDYLEAKTVGSSGSTVEQKIFKLGEETPWLYLSFEQTGNSHSDSLWTGPLSTSFSQVYEDSGVTSIWFKPADWAKYAKAGDWTVSNIFTTVTGWKDMFGANGTVTYNAPDINFKVTAAPEPISSALFVIGGAALAFSRRRKA